MNNLAGLAYTTGRVRVESDGTPWRPLVHVEDIGQAFLAALAAPREVVHNQAFNVGRSSENYRVSELADMVRDVIPGSQVEYAAGGGPDSRSYRVDCSKIDDATAGVSAALDRPCGHRAALYRVYGARLVAGRR